MWVCSAKWRRFYDELKSEFDMHIAADLVVCLGGFSGHICRHIAGFDEVHEFGRMLLEFCLEKALCVSNAWFEREEKRKVTFRMGES